MCSWASGHGVSDLRFGGGRRCWEVRCTEHPLVLSCALPWLAVVDVIAFVVLVHVGSLVFLVPVGKLVISDAKIVVGRCVTALSLFFLHELTVWSSLLFLV
jgi:hypothetical protein